MTRISWISKDVDSSWIGIGLPDRFILYDAASRKSILKVPLPEGVDYPERVLPIKELGGVLISTWDDGVVWLGGAGCSLPDRHFDIKEITSLAYAPSEMVLVEGAPGVRSLHLRTGEVTDFPYTKRAMNGGKGALIFFEYVKRDFLCWEAFGTAEKVVALNWSTKNPLQVVSSGRFILVRSFGLIEVFNARDGTRVAWIQISGLVVLDVGWNDEMECFVVVCHKDLGRKTTETEIRAIYPDQGDFLDLSRFPGRELCGVVTDSSVIFGSGAVVEPFSGRQLDRLELDL